MTARELLAHIQRNIAEIPECADRKVFIFSSHGKLECDDVAVSVSGNLWLIEK